MIARKDNPLASVAYDTGIPLASSDIGYDAVKDGSKRRRSPSRHAHEDRILKQKGRDKLSGAGFDIQKNFTAAAWAIRKHLDYVAAFKFTAKSGHADFDDALERFITKWSERGRCDVRRKHPLRRLVRLAEVSRTVGGDAGAMKVAGSGPSDYYRGKIAIIESDRIRTPKDTRERDQERWFNGVRENAVGEAVEYAVHKRKGLGYELDRIVPARSMSMLGYYDRIDQTRGISPLATAINQFKDSYQGFDYALAKLKVAQLISLIITTNSAEGIGEHTYVGGDPDEELVDDEEDVREDKYEVSFGDGPTKLELEDGEKAEILESKTPATETVNFLRLVLSIALKSLDIPYSFFDESFTNFYGSRGGVMQYLKSCANKRADLQEWLNEITRWRVGLAIVDGELALPAGMEFDDIRWHWIPAGVPWWDPSKEARGAALSVAGGFSNIADECAAIGTDAYENIDRNAEVLKYAKEKGVNIVLAGAEAFNAPPVVQADGETSDA